MFILEKGTVTIRIRTPINDRNLDHIVIEHEGVIVGVIRNAKVHVVDEPIPDDIKKL